MFKTRKTLAGYFCHRRFSHSSPYVRFFNLNAKKKHPHNEVAAERSLLKISYVIGLVSNFTINSYVELCMWLLLIEGINGNRNQNNKLSLHY